MCQRRCDLGELMLPSLRAPVGRGGVFELMMIELLCDRVRGRADLELKFAATLTDPRSQRGVPVDQSLERTASCVAVTVAGPAKTKV